jgi:dTDP-4-amino-4,6-dideoxygalactose transaminase
VTVGDEVIIPVNTFVATAEAIVHIGARPVLVDINPQTYNIDFEQIESKITPKTKVILPVHLYGQSAEMGAIQKIANNYGLFVIEDAAQAHGAEYKGSKVGSIGRAASFSFYPAKNLGAYGDAGAVVTNNEQIAINIRKLHDHGAIEKYQHDLIGFNCRLDTVQAAVLITKLNYLDRWNKMRQQNASLYNALLSNISGIVTPNISKGVKHVYHLYVIRIEDGDRDELRKYLQQNGVQTGIHYPKPIHLTQAFSYLGYREGDFPVAENYAKQILSLPMYPELTTEQIEYVAHKIKCFMEKPSS